ncbi:MULTISPECIES: hypothetical protein [Bacillus]|uniref:hypothetical protein n=1 Tax=Bacillus TaxID=1386 RepID=UPI0011A21BD9|nr:MULTISPECIES: hypothetical protein [Bacillus]MCY7738560.1 hypothetical protein [Bacillus safensis]
MKKYLIPIIITSILSLSIIPYSADATTKTQSFVPSLVKTELNKASKAPSTSVLYAKGKVRAQSIPPSTKWKVVDHFRGSSKNIDKASELTARILVGLPSLYNKYAGIAASAFFSTFFKQKPTRYYSTTQYVAYDKNYKYTIIDMYVYKDSKYSKQVGYEYKWFRSNR